MYHEITFLTGKKGMILFTKKELFTTESHLSHISIVSIADIYLWIYMYAYILVINTR